MSPKTLLIANRGEVAIRIARAAAELGIESVAVHPEDDATSLHVRRADRALVLPGRGAAAYLDVEAVVRAAREAGADAVHPGYGFLAESPALARACRDAGLVFVGPEAETLARLGDKGAARGLAESRGVPVLPGTGGPTTLEEARAFFASLGPGRSLMVKALSGGGGRGMRAVETPDALDAAWERCRSEAESAFGDGSLYVEARWPRARHVEVQIVGDGHSVVHLFERECTLQRRHQKLVEIAPSPTLPTRTRDALLEAAVSLASEVGYRGLGTFEFLVDADDDQRWVFIEANARLQVEHTVTEEVTGVDLVRTQLEIAGGARLADCGLAPGAVAVRGHAIQCRVNAERIDPSGQALPRGGTLVVFEPPTGPGVRTDTAAHAGWTIHPGFDPLLAKVVAHSPRTDFADALGRARRALAELRIEGVETNRPFLQALLSHPDVAAHRVTTGFVTEHAAELARAANADPVSPSAGHVGARVDHDDPLAVLEHGRGGPDAPSPEAPPTGPAGTAAVAAPAQGTIVSVDVAEGELVAEGHPLVVMEAMKMEHVVVAPLGGRVVQLAVAAGDTVVESHPLLFVAPEAVSAEAAGDTAELDPDHVRPDLAEVVERHAVGLDARRPEAVARRRKLGRRTARENLAALVDAGSFREYGALAVAAQRQRRSQEDLIAHTPADGLVAGVGTVNAAAFGERAARTVVCSYDYTVLAGTQGTQNHRKKDRLFEVAERWRLPLVFFAEGGGGRPGDTDSHGFSGLDCRAFQYFARLSGLVPLVGITGGRCFAGNAALLGCCDVVIAHEDATIGMGGPAMIEGGGLGVFRPEEVGPIDVQRRNGVVDVVVADDAEAVDVAKRYLSYFQGDLAGGECGDQRRLRHVIPENRLRIYDVRQVIDQLCDVGSVLELRRDFGHGMVTALARVDGRAIGVVANNPAHLAGAIDSDAADKAARFMQLCDAFDVPLLFLCDTPGIMVGPEAEKSGTVRHAARMFVVGASLSVPFFTIVLRKGYGLGAQAMAGGSFHAPFFIVSWPTGEFGGMGLEGAVKLGFRKELEAQSDPEARRALYEKLVGAAYDRGKAVSTASVFEIDDVIDPAESRDWIGRALASAPAPAPRDGKKRPCVDAW